MLLVVFGIFCTYFITFSIRIINHNDDFIGLYDEFDQLGDLYSCFEAQYFLGYEALYLYNDPVNYQTSFFTNNQFTWNTINNRWAEGKQFWANIDGFLDDNADATQSYKTQEYFLKGGDVCDFITSVAMTPDMINECKTALQGASRLGFAQFISAIFQTFQDQLNNVVTSNYARNQTVSIITTTDFQGLDNLLYYGDLVFTQYLKGITSNLNDVLSNQIGEAYIFLIIGIIMMVGGFLYGWYRFVSYMKGEFLIVKKTYSVLPLDMIVNNGYIKRWLKDNSDHTIQ